MAIGPSKKAVESHFRNQHRIVGTQLQDALAFADSIPQLNDPITINLPHDYSFAIQGIAIYTGYSCTSCRYLTRNNKNIIIHQTNANYLASDSEPRWQTVML
jgi:hypothetical protein